jgi:hypothetical protein
VFTGCVLRAPDVSTPASNPNAASAGVNPMPRVLGMDETTRKTNQLLASAGADKLEGLKPMDHSMNDAEGHEGHGTPEKKHETGGETDAGHATGHDLAKPNGARAETEQHWVTHDHNPMQEKSTPKAGAPSAENKPIVEEMKKLSEEIKAASEALKKKSTEATKRP